MPPLHPFMPTLTRLDCRDVPSTAVVPYVGPGPLFTVPTDLTDLVVDPGPLDAQPGPGTPVTGMAPDPPPTTAPLD